MELRKDPITRSWVITGDEPAIAPQPNACRFCPDARNALQVVSSLPALDGGPWSVRSVVHPSPIYHVEGEPARRGDGLYDRMQTVGAHEVLVETPHHDRQSAAPDAQIDQVLTLAAHRIQDLKRDRRFKYVTVFKNRGQMAGEEFEHPTSELTATTFVPRRVLYELRACREYFAHKERCVFCDILSQEEHQAVRVVEARGDFIALCPYAPRVPYEVWVMPRIHEASFERNTLARPNTIKDLAVLLQRTLARIRAVTDSYHMVLHTSPNTQHRSDILGYWKTIDDDYHWHIEIMPVLAGKAKSYTFKEVYYSPMSPEAAAERLRKAPA